MYALEGYPAFQPILTPLFETIDCGDIQAVTSELTLAEVLVKPLLDRSCEPFSNPQIGEHATHAL